MIRVYCAENLTQRGVKNGLSMTGAVASAARYLIKAILKGDTDVRRICQTSDKGVEIIRGQIASEKGLGRECILKFYDGVDGINENVVKEHLANLKASGNYARIVKEVTEEIAREQAAERAELERKAKAAQKADEAAKAKAAIDKAFRL